MRTDLHNNKSPSEFPRFPRTQGVASVARLRTTRVICARLKESPIMMAERQAL